MLLCGNGKHDFKIFNDSQNDNNAKLVYIANSASDEVKDPGTIIQYRLITHLVFALVKSASHTSH